MITLEAKKRYCKGRSSSKTHMCQAPKGLPVINDKADWASQVALVVKHLPANAGDIRDEGLIPGSGRSPGEGHGNPLQYSCLEKSMDREVWWAAVHRIAKSQTRLKLLSTHTA